MIYDEQRICILDRGDIWDENPEMIFVTHNVVNGYMNV